MLPLVLGSSSKSGTSTGSSSSGSSSTGSSSSSSESSISYSNSVSKSNIISGESVNFSANISSASTGAKDYELKLYLSTNSTINSSDTLLGTISVNNSTTNTQTLAATIPTTLVPDTEIKPTTYYYGFLSSTSTSTTSFSTVEIYPYKSKIGSFSLGATSSSDTFTFDSDTTQYFFSVFSTSGISKITLSAYEVSAGLDVGLSLYTISSGVYNIVGSETNSNPAQNYEFGSYTVGGSGIFAAGIMRIRKVSGTTGTFKVAGMADRFTAIPYLGSGGSCTGGGNAFYANRCITYLENAPTNNTDCVNRQGAGSTYSSSCSSTSEVSKRCYFNPLLNNYRAIMRFYTANDNLTTAATACGNDILF